MAKSASALCKNVNKEIKSQAITLAKAIISMQDKIEQTMPEFIGQPIVQVITSTQGEKVLKANPAMQEFRALVRDYAGALQDFDRITKSHDSNTSGKVSQLGDLRSRFKVAK